MKKLLGNKRMKATLSLLLVVSMILSGNSYSVGRAYASDGETDYTRTSASKDGITVNKSADLATDRKTVELKWNVEDGNREVPGHGENGATGVVIIIDNSKSNMDGKSKNIMQSKSVAKKLVESLCGEDNSDVFVSIITTNMQKGNNNGNPNEDDTYNEGIVRLFLSEQYNFLSKGTAIVNQTYSWSNVSSDGFLKGSNWEMPVTPYSNNIEQLNKIINSINTANTKHCNIQASLEEAERIISWGAKKPIDGKYIDNSVVIVLSDGYPTMCYKENAISETETTLNDGSKLKLYTDFYSKRLHPDLDNSTFGANVKNDKRYEYERENGKAKLEAPGWYTINNEFIEEYDSNKLEKANKGWKYNISDTDYIKSDDSGENEPSDNKCYNRYVIRNCGVPTISEAERIKNSSNTKIIALQLGENVEVQTNLKKGSKENRYQIGQYVMRNIASRVSGSDKLYYYELFEKYKNQTDKETKEKEVVNEIIEQVNAIAEASSLPNTLTDTLPSYLTIDSSALPEGVTYDVNSRELTFNLDKLMKDHKADVTITATLDYSEVDKEYTLFPTSEKCTVNFTNTSGERDSFEVSSPQITLTAYKVVVNYYVDNMLRANSEDMKEFPSAMMTVSEWGEYTLDHGEGKKYSDNVRCETKVDDTTTILVANDKGNYVFEMPEADVDVNVYYETNKCTVSFYISIEDNQPMATTTVAIGTKLNDVAGDKNAKTKAEEYLTNLTNEKRDSGDLATDRAFGFEAWRKLGENNTFETIGESEIVNNDVSLYLDYSNKITWYTARLEVNGDELDTTFTHGSGYKFNKIDNGAASQAFNDYANNNDRMKKTGVKEYNLIGWYEKDSEDKTPKGLSEFVLDRDKTFVACYTEVPNVYNVTYLIQSDSNTYTIKIDPVTHGAASINIFDAGKVYVPEGSDKAFICSGAFEVKNSNGASVSNSSIDSVTETLFVYAKNWKKEDGYYTVRFFDASGKQINENNDQYAYGSDLSHMTATCPEKDAYYEYDGFRAWREISSNNGETIYVDVQEADLKYVTKSMDLYADFNKTLRTYSYEFGYKDVNDGYISLINYTDIPAGGVATVPSITSIDIVSEDGITVIGQYAINGWEAQDDSDYTCVLKDGKALASRNVQYIISFEYKDSNGASSHSAVMVNAGEKISNTPSAFDWKDEKNEYKFAGWTLNDESIDLNGYEVNGPANFVASYTESVRSYSVKIVKKYFDPNSDLKYDSVLVGTVSGAGFTFGEKVEIDLSEYKQEQNSDYYFESIMDAPESYGLTKDGDKVSLNIVGDNMEIDLKFVQNMYTARFFDVKEAKVDANGAVIVTSEAIEFETYTDYKGREVSCDFSGEKYSACGINNVSNTSIFADTDKYEYKFAGWVYYDENGTANNFDGIMPSGGLKLYPAFTAELRKFSVVYYDHANGELNGEFVPMSSAINSVEYGEEITTEQLTPYVTSEGAIKWLAPYWEYIDDGTKTVSAGSLFCVTKDVAFYSVRPYEKATYKYTFYCAAEGATAPAVATVPTEEFVVYYGDSEPSPATVYEWSDKQYDYKFQYWIDITDVPETERSTFITSSTVNENDGYKFKEETVTGDKYFMAYYKQEFHEYTIKFMNENNTLFSCGTVDAVTGHYGKHFPEAPGLVEANNKAITLAVSEAAIMTEKDKTKTYTHGGFRIWNVIDSSVSNYRVDISNAILYGDTIFVACYDAINNHYNIIYENEDGTEYASVSAITAGAIDPVYKVDVTGPEKASDENYSYKFKEWVYKSTGRAPEDGEIKYIDEHIHLIPTYTKTSLGGGGTYIPSDDHPISEDPKDDTKTDKTVREDQKVTPEPDIEMDMDDDATPQGSTDIDMELDEDDTPQGLAKTGTVPTAGFYIMSVMLAAIAIFMKKRSKEENA